MQSMQNQAHGLIVEVRGASRRYPGVLALDNADFTMQPGEVRALLGKNGAGKSTLIRSLTGAESPDSGTIAINGHVLKETGTARTLEAQSLGVAAVYQELSLVAGMSIAENMFLGTWPTFLGTWPAKGIVLDHAVMATRAREALQSVGLALDPRREVSTLTTAEQQLVEIARAFMGNPKLVILDEPTSSLHHSEVQRVFDAVRALAARGIAVIYVSHRMAEIREIAHTATVIRDGRIIETLPVAEARTEDIVEMMLGRAEAGGQALVSTARDEVMLEVQDLGLAPKLHGISFTLRSGEVLGLAGILGSGRSELLRAIAGVDRPDHGTVMIAGQDTTALDYAVKTRLGIGLTPENRKEEGILPLLGVDENITLTDLDRVSNGPALNWSRLRAAAAQVIARLSIKTANGATPIGTLSGGNQQKAVIGRWIHARSRIFLMDEPTRGVDVESKNQIYGIIRKVAAEGAGVIFVSSEAEELPKVCDRVLVIADGSIAGEFLQGEMDANSLMSASMARHETAA